VFADSLCRVTDRAQAPRFRKAFFLKGNDTGHVNKNKFYMNLTVSRDFV
jgi:hypothetical protein